MRTNQVGSSEIEVDPSARSQIAILREKSGDDLSIIGVVHKYLSVTQVMGDHKMVRNGGPLQDLRSGVVSLVVSSVSHPFCWGCIAFWD